MNVGKLEKKASKNKNDWWNGMITTQLLSKDTQTDCVTRDTGLIIKHGDINALPTERAKTSKTHIYYLLLFTTVFINLLFWRSINN